VAKVAQMTRKAGFEWLTQEERPMEEITRRNLENLWSEDRQLQNGAFTTILEATDKPVDWAYEAWDALVGGLSHKDNHVRAISAQVLCNLARSDPEKRMLKDFPSLLAVTKDERFVTARHTLLAIWKIGAAGKEQQTMLVEGRFKECITEKMHPDPLRYHPGFQNLYDVVKDDAVRAKALERSRRREISNTARNTPACGGPRENDSLCPVQSKQERQCQRYVINGSA
jgi:hypothetical protein